MLKMCCACLHGCAEEAQAEACLENADRHRLVAVASRAAGVRLAQGAVGGGRGLLGLVSKAGDGALAV